MRVATMGTFDILHAGHFAFLQLAKQLGDELLVVVVPDKIVKENKGAEHPTFDENQRLAFINQVPLVDNAVIDCLENRLNSVVIFKPDVYVFGDDQRTEYDEKIIKLLEDNDIKPHYIWIRTSIHISSTQIKVHARQ